MTDILLIYPPVSYTADLNLIKDDLILDHPPLGFLYIAGFLEEKGFKVKVADTNTLVDLKKTINLIKKEKPKIIGLSALTSNIRGAYQLAVEVKKKFNNEIKIGLGGHHLSSDPELIKRFPVFDFGITGEGEITFAKLVEEIIKKKKKVKGLFLGETPNDLDKLPLPSRHLIDFGCYQELWANNLITSRGCPYHCLFCSRPAVSRLCRFRSPDLVVKEMFISRKITGKNQFVFLDDTINLNRKHLMEICQEIIDSGLKPKWSAQARLNLIDEKLVKQMAQAGCNKLMFGVESGNTRVRNEIIHKGISDKQIKKGFDLCWRYGIEPDAFLMLGFPTETKKEMEDTVNFAQRFRPNMIGVHLTLPLPGSLLWEELVGENPDYQQIIDRYIKGELGEGFRNNWPKYIPKGLTLEDLTLARNLAQRRFYLRPSYVFYRLKKDLTSVENLKKDIIEALSLIRFGRSHWGD